MNIYRALVGCPLCLENQEVWNSNGSILPTSLIKCFNCNNMYDSDSHMTGFLCLRSNSNITTTNVRDYINN